MKFSIRYATYLIFIWLSYFLTDCKKKDPEPIYIKDTVKIVTIDTIIKINEKLKIDTIYIRDTVFVSPLDTGKLLNHFQVILLGAQSNATGSYFDALGGVVLTGSNASSNPQRVDITYAALGAFTEPTLLSYQKRGDPSTGLTASVPPGAKRTYFSNTGLSPVAFYAINRTSSIGFVESFVSSSSPERIFAPQGSILSFLTQEGKKGIIKVVEVTPGLSGSILLDIKVEKP
jgi:hypothetical protein